jgi:hypothetical protein
MQFELRRMTGQEGASAEALMPKLGTTIWDATLARRLYDEGATYTQIGKPISRAAGSAIEIGQDPP